MKLVTAPTTCPPADAHATAAGWWTRLSCRLWGHHVDNVEFRHAAERLRRCRCGAAYLGEDGVCTRVRHTLSCFLGHHTYDLLTERDGHREYVCVRCGHPLLFRREADPYAGRVGFPKSVRYLCGLFGHGVRRVVERHGLTEYACHCGHTFLKPAASLAHVTHPLACVARGHYIQFVERRAGFAEYVCRTCGHPFCFADPER